MLGAAALLLFGVGSEALAQTATPTLMVPNASASATVTPTLAVPNASATAKMTPAGVVTVVVTATPGTPTPTATPTVEPTATATPTMRFNPAATPAPGGDVEVLSKGDVHTTDGHNVGAGSFQINNTSDKPDVIHEVRISASEPIVFGSLTLTTSGGSVTVSSPSGDNTFSFQPGVEIAPGRSGVFTLGADVGSEDTSSGDSSSTATPDTTGTATPEVTATPTETTSATLAGIVATGAGPGSGGRGGGVGRFFDSIGVGLAMAGLLTGLFGIGERRWRRLAGMSLVLIGVALYAGCGSEQTSQQSIVDITADNTEGPIQLTGIPAELGSVSRPQPLVFPGSTGTTTTGTGLTTLQ